MILLFSDFGWDGPYVGQMKMQVAAYDPMAPVVDLMHDAPKFNPIASSYLLAALIGDSKGLVVCGVVDPGVGSSVRKPVALRTSQGWFVGPGNGLFDVIASKDDAPQWYEIIWQPEYLSSSFHGRDLFAPVATFLYQGEPAENFLAPLSSAPVFCSLDLNEVIYVDGFGNCMIGMQAERVSLNASVLIKGRVVGYAETFAEVDEGELFWYANSQGLVEVAANSVSAADLLNVSVGEPVSLN